MNWKFAIAVAFLALPTFALAQGGLGTIMSGPSPWIDVTSYGAVGDAQTSPGQDCSVSLHSRTVTCSASISLTSADQWKSIEVPGAGTSSTTLLTRITAVNNTAHQFTMFDEAQVGVSGVTVTWGTDNYMPLQTATTACPSVGCVLYFPKGNYMFGAGGISMTSQQSFQIIGQGNSSRQQAIDQAGVRLLTASPIVVMTLGSSGSANFGGFQLWNFTFQDTSENGSAVGGLLIHNTSDALIAETDFEHFNGATAYGIQADPTGGSINNITLLNDKGHDNSIWYDGSINTGDQDGPVVIGGDIFPANLLINATCYGIKAPNGPLRVFGAHFDVDSGGTTGLGRTACVGVQSVGGQIYGKFEASGSHPGNGVELTGSSNGAEVDAIFNNLVTAVTIDSSGANNRVIELVAGMPNTADIVDNGTNDTVEIHHASAGSANSLSFGGPVSATSVNKLTLTPPSTGATLTILNGKTLTVNNSLTVAGTDGDTLTVPTSGGTAVVTAGTQTITGTKYGTGNILQVCSAGGTGCSATPGNFTTSGVGTNFETITGLTWTLPASTAATYAFDCHLSYLQNTANANMAWGMQVSQTPTLIRVENMWNASGTTIQVLSTVITNTTATAVSTAAQPSDTTTIRSAHIWGFIENPSTSANLVSIMTKTTAAADTVTVEDGSYCKIN